MTLRQKLLFAQVPLALALLLVGGVAVNTLRELGRAGEIILEDNYRSVLSMQEVLERLERLDSAALLLVAGETGAGEAQFQNNMEPLEHALRTQEGNLTERGEGEATRRLRGAWSDYHAQLEHFLRLAPEERRAEYFGRISPGSLRTWSAAREVLSLNQDAMVRKSEAQQRQSQRVNLLMILAVVGALGAGLLASATLTQRALRPVGVLSRAVRRLGEGDLGTRAGVEGQDEIAGLARDFNAMAEALQRYQRSSLGELLQAQASAQAAIDSLPDPVVVFGGEGGVLNVNRAAEEALRLSAEEGGALGRVEPEARAVLERVRAHVLGGRGAYLPAGYEEAVRLEAPEGARWLLPRGSPVYGEQGGVVGVTVLLQDVTRLRRFDELKNDMVATVAHEFRTPLTSLRMAIHLCLEEAAGPVTVKQADLLQAARADCERLQDTVADLLDLSRLRSGRAGLQIQPVPPRELVESVLVPYRRAAEEKGIVLRRENGGDGAWVEADPERLQLVLSNLVANAVRHTPAGGEVVVRVREVGSGLRFEVADTGEGIAPEHLTRIFEKFYRVPGAGSGGAGLGLSIAREIVQAHGGELDVISAPGQGSTFGFTLRLK